jgi:hypothetical protein
MLLIGDPISPLPLLGSGPDTHFLKFSLLSHRFFCQLLKSVVRLPDIMRQIALSPELRSGFENPKNTR